MHKTQTDIHSPLLATHHKLQSKTPRIYTVKCVTVSYSVSVTDVCSQHTAKLLTMTNHSLIEK